MLRPMRTSSTLRLALLAPRTFSFKRPTASSTAVESRGRASGMPARVLTALRIRLEPACSRGEFLPVTILPSGSSIRIVPGLITSQEIVVVNVSYTLTVGACTSTEQKAISILPLPVAGFEAEFITPDDNQEQLLVRVFNIQPAGGKKYIWESTPEPINPISPKNNNKEFIIAYDANSIGPESIALRLTATNREGCQGLPVEKTVLPVIQSAELIGLQENEVGMVEVTHIILREGLKIPRRSVDSEMFNIRAYPLPIVVGKIVFGLKGPTEAVTITGSSNGSNGGYYLMENAGLPVMIGDYTLKCTPLTMKGTPGKALEIKFSIFEEDVILAVRPVGSSDDAITFLRRRDADLRKEMDSLSPDTGLAGTTAFKLTQSLLSFQGEAEELNGRYSETMNTLTESAARARKGSPRHARLLRLMTVATEFFMDRQVVASPDELGTSAETTLLELLPGMKKTGLNLKALKTEWKGNDLKKTLSAPAADAFNKMLK